MKRAKSPDTAIMSKSTLGQAFTLLATRTGGVPRLMNTLCDTALTCAYADSIQAVSKAVIGTAAEELQWLPYAKRINDRRLKERTARAVKMGSLSGEQERRLANIGNRLNQLDTLTPELSSISLKMGNIELLLKQILKVIQKEELLTGAPKKNQHRRSPG